MYRYFSRPCQKEFMVCSEQQSVDLSSSPELMLQGPDAVLGLNDMTNLSSVCLVCSWKRLKLKHWRCSESSWCFTRLHLIKENSSWLPFCLPSLLCSFAAKAVVVCRSGDSLLGPKSAQAFSEVHLETCILHVVSTNAPLYPIYTQQVQLRLVFHISVFLVVGHEVLLNLWCQSASSVFPPSLPPDTLCFSWCSELPTFCLNSSNSSSTSRRVICLLSLKSNDVFVPQKPS